MAYRLHLGARAVAYGEKNLTFQGPLPKKIELLARNELLNLTYDQEIQVQRKDNKTFEVRIAVVLRLVLHCGVMMLPGWGDGKLISKAKCPTTDHLFAHKFDSATKEGKISP